MPAAGPSPAADPRSTLFSCLAPPCAGGLVPKGPVDRPPNDAAETEVKGVTGVVVKEPRHVWTISQRY